MPCPFCAIASATPPSSSPPILASPAGSAYLVLSTPLLVAFLDIAPLSRGHLLLCPRTHRTKCTSLTPSEAAAIGFWIPVLSRAVMRALWGGEEGHWNVIQANGAEAGQTVPHAHFHVIPREGPEGKKDRVGEMDDAERKNIALGEGPREKLGKEEGEEVSKLVKVEVDRELRRLVDEGVLGGVGEDGEVWMRVSEKGLKL